MTKIHEVSRRSFLKQSAVTGLAGIAFPYVLPSGVSAQSGRSGPNGKIGIGMIGMGRQAIFANLPPFLQSPDTHVVAVCDVDGWRLENARRKVDEFYTGVKEKGTYHGCAALSDFRDLLSRDDIDAVMISTPDHWHVPMAVMAIQACKDVCCEKPLTRSIEEGRRLSDLVTAHKRIFRTDSEFRSLPFFHRACELVRNGRIGKLHTIRTGVPQSDVACPMPPAMPVPPELNYDMWLGPAPEAPYTEKRVHPPHDYGRPGWMRVRDYCDGLITNWGTHLNDIAQWGHGTDRTGPISVEGTGESPDPSGLWNVLLKFDVQYEYADGVRLFYSNLSERVFVRFEGEEGWIDADYGKQELTAQPDSVLQSEIKPDEIHLRLKGDKEDFIASVISREPALEDAEVGHRTTSLCHLGHIAIQVGQKLTWNPDRENFVENDHANALLTHELRTPWRLNDLISEL